MCSGCTLFCYTGHELTNSRAKSSMGLPACAVCQSIIANSSSEHGLSVSAEVALAIMGYTGSFISKVPMIFTQTRLCSDPQKIRIFFKNF